MRVERDIPLEWIERTRETPDYIENRDDGTIHYICSIPERDGKYLRVIVNPLGDPCRIITLFLDRRIKI